MVCLAQLLTAAVKNYNKSLEKLQDIFFKTETKMFKTGLSFLSSRRLETKMVSRTTSLEKENLRT